MESKPITVVGHRGAAKLWPENTLKGFRNAIKLGVDAMECDVHLTRDGHLVVIHDATLDRTTNGTGRVRAHNLATLRQLDAGQGEQIPLIEEVLGVVKGKVRLLCELKGNDVEGPAVDLVRAHGMEKEVAFTSFNLKKLARVRTRGADLHLCALFKTGPSDNEIQEARDLRVDNIDILYKNVCLRLVEHIHGLGIGLRAWNPDTLPEQQAMIALGVREISSNRPDILLKYLCGKRAKK
jgi:glycerophosphoryl diester phosphodiesterase